MLISPKTWRKFLKRRLASVIAAARAVRPVIPVFYHSDGDVRDIIGELIEIGVTILDPVQPECMDPFEIKRQYGDRLTLWGDDRNANDAPPRHSGRDPGGSQGVHATACTWWRVRHWADT